LIGPVATEQEVSVLWFRRWRRYPRGETLLNLPGLIGSVGRYYVIDFAGAGTGNG